MRECNLLVGTSVLEEGIDIPKCNLVIHFDVPQVYRSYVQSKGRARAQDAYYILMIEEDRTECFVNQLAQYFEIEQVGGARCEHEPAYGTMKWKMCGNIPLKRRNFHVLFWLCDVLALSVAGQHTAAGVTFSRVLFETPEMCESK